jgi:spermidine synthase
MKFYRTSASALTLSRREIVRNIVLNFAIASLGVSAFITQITLMRELLCVFSGNELVFGIVLGNWLLLSGLGAALGRTAALFRSPIGLLVAGQTLVAVVPIVCVVVLRTRQDALFGILMSGYARGSEIGVAETVATCFLLLAPYCLVTGYLLALASALFSEQSNDITKSKGIGQVYFLDNVGSVAGGLLFTFILVHLLDHFGILYVPAMLNLAMAFLAAWVFGKRILAVVPAALAVVLAVAACTVDLDQWTTQRQFAPQQVAFHGNSPYGALVVTESSGQLNFIENGTPSFSIQSSKDGDSINVVQVEEAVHYAMAQRPDAVQVLLISGGASGTAREILDKYQSVRFVDYVELDPLILEAAARFAPHGLTDPLASDRERLRITTADGRMFLKQSQQMYDVVIVDAAGPSTSLLNRFYTREFFAEVKRSLSPEGVLCFPLGTYNDYMSRELADMIAVGYKTAKTAFANVEILPCGKNYFLASDGPLTVRIAERLETAGIKTKYVNRDYMTSELAPERLAGVSSAVTEDAPINEDFNPILYFYHLRHWMSQFSTRFGLLWPALVLVLFVYVIRLRPVALAIFSGGFAASALEVVLLLGAQILYGCLYYQVGLIATAFMLGLGIGSWTAGRFDWLSRRGQLAWLGLGIAIYAALLPVVLIALTGLGGSLSAAAAQSVVPLLSLALAVLVGMEFPLAGKIDFKSATSTASRLFTADFLGAAVGALLVSTLLIPLLGVMNVCLIAGGLNLLSAGVILISGIKYRTKTM